MSFNKQFYFCVICNGGEIEFEVSFDLHSGHVATITD